MIALLIVVLVGALTELAILGLMLLIGVLLAAAACVFLWARAG